MILTMKNKFISFIIYIMARNELCHLRELVNNYKNKILLVLQPLRNFLLWKLNLIFIKCFAFLFENTSLNPLKSDSSPINKGWLEYKTSHSSLQQVRIETRVFFLCFIFLSLFFLFQLFLLTFFLSQIFLSQFFFS